MPLHGIGANQEPLYRLAQEKIARMRLPLLTQPQLFCNDPRDIIRPSDGERAGRLQDRSPAIRFLAAPVQTIEVRLICLIGAGFDAGFSILGTTSAAIIGRRHPASSFSPRGRCFAIPFQDWKPVALSAVDGRRSLKELIALRHRQMAYGEVLEMLSVFGKLFSTER